MRLPGFLLGDTECSCCARHHTRGYTQICHLAESSHSHQNQDERRQKEEQDHDGKDVQLSRCCHPTECRAFVWRYRVSTWTWIPSRFPFTHRVLRWLRRRLQLRLCIFVILFCSFSTNGMQLSSQYSLQSYRNITKALEIVFLSKYTFMLMRKDNLLYVEGISLFF